MKNPSSIHMQNSNAVRAAGWQAESRDSNGHLISTHAPFLDDDDDAIVWFVREETKRGHTVTIWPADAS